MLEDLPQQNSRQYEFNYILNPELNEDQISAYTKKLKSFIIEAQGSVRQEKTPIKQPIAYLIKKQKQGYFGSIVLEIDPEKLPELEKKLKLEKEILRYWILHWKEKPIRMKMKKRRKLLPATQVPEVKQIQESDKVQQEQKPQEPEKQIPKKAKLEEIDKKLEEILEEL